MKKTLSLLLCAVMLLGTVSGILSVYADEVMPFEDVKADAWYYDAVADVYEAGLMKGKTNTKFDPSAPMSRAEFVTVLSRLAAINAANYSYGDSLNFTDTDSDAWYADAAGWAVETGLSTGTSEATFSPTREITRQEMAVLIVRFVQYLGETVPDNSKVEKFADAGKIASWATADIETMRKYGFVQGDQNGNFNPEGKADRASVATIAMRLLPYVTTTNVVENGKSDYVIVADETAADAAERLQYQVEYTTGVKLDIVDKSSSKKAIVLKVVNDDKLGADGYEIKADGDTVTVTGDTPEGIYKGAVRFILRATFDNTVKFTSAANERCEFELPIGKLTINGNDISKYTILYPANASDNTVTGVYDLQEYIEKACGVRLETKVGASSDYAIIVEEAAVKVGGDGNENDNFSVRSEGNSIILTGGAARGAMYACYDFLEDVIGWCFMTESQEYLSHKDTLDVSGLDYSEAPGFMSRQTYSPAYNGSVDMRNKHKMWNIPWTGGSCHTFATLDNDYETGNMNTDQSDNPCLTDPYIFEVMKRNLLALLEAHPDAKLVSVSQNDTLNHCECERCLAKEAEYGGVPSGTMIWFVNKMSDAVVEAGYTDVIIHTFAYTYTLQPPTGIKPNDNVMVQVCSIDECFTHPLENHNNFGKFAEHLKAWSELNCKMFIWNYDINFLYSIGPFANIKYDVLAGNMKLFHDNNAIGVFSEGLSIAKERGEFDRLRAYLVAKLTWNPNMTEDEFDSHIKKFMEGYYGKGWETVYEAMNLWLEKDFSCFHIFENPSARVLYFKKNSELLVEMLDEAELHAESMLLFDNIDCSQIQFNFMDVSVKFNDLYKSDDPADVALSQELSKQLQDKILKFGISGGNMSSCIMFPNFTEFTVSPIYWRLAMFGESGQMVDSMSKVTVDYPKLTYVR